LSSLIAAEPDLRVLYEAGLDATGAPEDADIALFDLDEADDQVFDRLRETALKVRTIALSISEGAALSLKIFQAGAAGLVSKRQSPVLLLKAIRHVDAGEAWLGRGIATQVLDLARAHGRRLSHPDGSSLTARDERLIKLVGEGWRNADIARYLVASEATVRAGLTSIFRKLGLTDRFALMLYASQHGYVSATDRPRQREAE